MGKTCRPGKKLTHRPGKKPGKRPGKQLGKQPVPRTILTNVVDRDQYHAAAVSKINGAAKPKLQRCMLDCTWASQHMFVP